MAKFVAGKPQTTSTPGITVDAGLDVGFHRFRLVVIDDQGKASKADELVVEVRSGRIVIPGGIVTPPIVTRPIGSSPAPLASSVQPAASTTAARRTSRKAAKTGSKT
ncbi:hypothetical protein VVD49_06405 [Uliginosibacterium sp. H3]|uniref:Uncharacterized protein n=1 Tax=Uliginosibacterium silvisoli TaxID=3114758 RepID=A0ABU6K100_9RHOO|nr:hypothetical protein [Uliginosibacterium sp. H3]